MDWSRKAGIVVIVQCTASVAVAAPCAEPPPFEHTIPDGASASRDAMLAAQRALKAYDTVVIAYGACLRDSGKSIHEGDAVDQALRQVAAQFNDQLKIFKQRNGAG